MTRTNRISLIGFTADRAGLPEQVAEAFVDAELRKLSNAERWRNPDWERVPAWVANAVVDAAKVYAAERNAERKRYLDETDRGPWPVSLDDVARLVGQQFHLAPAQARGAVLYWVRNIESNWDRHIDAEDIHAGDLLAILEGLVGVRDQAMSSSGTHTRANARQ